jgi:hypothetical protein
VERARLPTDPGKPIHILEMEDHSVFHTLRGGMILRAVLLPPLRDYPYDEKTSALNSIQIPWP